MGVPHPLAGVGYCGTIALPFDPPPSAIPIWCKVLNHAEHHLHDFVPRIGAWGLRSANNQITYTLFCPTNEADAGVPSMIMNWLVTRMMWVRKEFWTSGSGLDHEEDPS
jgi:hypothetical protein